VHITPLPLPEHYATEPLRGRIGLIALATDMTSESDLRRMLPNDVGLYSNRVRHENPMSLEALARIAEDLPRAGHDLLPGIELDVIAYGCTSGTIAMGESHTLELLKRSANARHATTPVTASLAALAGLGARRVSVLTPYRSDVNRALGDYYRERGLDIINVSGFEMDDDYTMSAIAPEEIIAAGLKATSAEADALFISCTALHASLAVERLERALNRPVVTSNQSMVWHALQLLGITAPHTAPGQLFHGKRGSD